nr:MAG TPA: hypothetical protein [Caudoviricetes sp.]
MAENELTSVILNDLRRFLRRNHYGTVQTLA